MKIPIFFHIAMYIAGLRKIAMLVFFQYRTALLSMLGTMQEGVKCHFLCPTCSAVTITAYACVMGWTLIKHAKFGPDRK